MAGLNHSGMHTYPDIIFITPSTPAQLDAARPIFTEYAAQLGIDLRLQNFNAELQNLPGDYAAPQGALILARADGDVALTLITSTQRR